MLAITIVLFVVPHNQQFVKILQFFSHIVFPCSETKILIYKKEDFTMKSSLDLNTYEHVQTDPLPLHFQLKIHAQLLYKTQWLHQTLH